MLGFLFKGTLHPPLLWLGSACTGELAFAKSPKSFASLATTVPPLSPRVAGRTATKYGLVVNSSPLLLDFSQGSFGDQTRKVLMSPRVLRNCLGKDNSKDHRGNVRSCAKSGKLDKITRTYASPPSCHWRT